MDSNFQKKIKNNSIKIAILYDANSYQSALLLKDKIETRYPNKIQDYTIQTVLLPYNKKITYDANLYYLFPTDSKNIQLIINKAKKIKALTFSYLNSDLNNGIMLSLDIGKKVKPIINLNAAKSGEITFRPILLKISKIYTTQHPTISNGETQL